MYMSDSTDVAVKDEDQALIAVSDEAQAAVAAAQDEEYGDENIQTPILKVAQQLTREVAEGEATPGEFINTLTNEALGDTVEMIVSFYSKGRFASDKKNNRAYVAFDSTIPAGWAELVGEEFVGTPFAEYPEAEEEFKRAVNEKEREWEHGPLVSTTHNYTGYIIVPGEDDEQPDYQPVRLSMKRTDVPAARKINSLHRAVVRNKPKWDVVLKLTTKEKESSGYKSYIINPSDIKIVRTTSPEEKALAAELAIAVTSGRTVSPGADDALSDKATEPKADGALAV